MAGGNAHQVSMTGVIMTLEDLRRTGPQQLRSVAQRRCAAAA